LAGSLIKFNADPEVELMLGFEPANSTCQSGNRMKIIGFGERQPAKQFVAQAELIGRDGH